MSNAKELNEQQEIVAHFQKLREQQQDLANEMSKVDEEFREHKRVAQTLEKLEGDKRCYRLIGDSLVEYKVKDAILVLRQNLENLEALMARVNTQITEKGKEINEYRKEKNIRFVDEKEVMQLRKASAANAVAGSAPNVTAK